VGLQKHSLDTLVVIQLSFVGCLPWVSR